MIEVTRWLVKNEHLRPEHCPIRYSEHGSWYILASSPTHSNGKRFNYPTQVESIWIEKDYGAGTQIENACTIIKHVGLDPARFKVRFD